jgi:hypothetical protein
VNGFGALAQIRDVVECPVRPRRIELRLVQLQGPFGAASRFGVRSAHEVVHFVPQGLHELIARHVATHQDLSGTELHAQVTFANQQLT